MTSQTSSIGIVGAGIAGLHLGLYLRERGVAATLYAERTAAEVRAGRLLNTVALMGATRARERSLRVHTWDCPDWGVFCVNLRVAGDPPLAFQGTMAAPALFIDFRLHLPRLMEDFFARGGRIEHAAPTPDDLPGLALRHDLLVVATGRAGLPSVFPRIPERCPYDAPQRRLHAGLYHGVRLPEPMGMGFNVIPGQGEIFESPYLSVFGRTSCLLVEAIPGGVLDVLTQIRYDDDPQAFNRTALEVVREHAPAMYARIDPTAFGLARPLDLLQGAVTPGVRRGYVTFDNGRTAIALGDAHITNDPIVGQGANAASRAAFLLGDIIAARLGVGAPFDEPFCVETERTLREDATAVTDWSNAFLQPPPPHAMRLLAAAAQSRAVADAFITNFNDPKRQWSVLSTPDGTEAFLRELGAA